MEITEVRVKLVEQTAERLLAFCSITIDAAFVVRDIKIIDGPNGPFVAMPSRKLASHCRACGGKNPRKAGFCSHCGAKLAEGQPPRDGDGRVRLYADIAHPINAACRDLIQRRIVSEYESELVRARQPGYVSRYDAIGDEEPRPRG
jgi:stage V sporulation protein G